MSLEVCGIPLVEFGDPIEHALGKYQALLGDDYSFDIDGAVHLGYVEGKSTARSVTDIYSKGQIVANLAVLAFAPRDGTGDANTFTADQLDTGVFPVEPRYFPRSKQAVHSEAHLTIAAKKIDTQDDPQLFAGNLSVLELLRGNLIADVGYVGHDSHSFAASLPSGAYQRGHRAHPRATLTCGYRNGLSSPLEPGERFGDPHTITNRVEYAVQVAGFISITPEMAPAHLDLFRLLNAKPFRHE